MPYNLGTDNPAMLLDCKKWLDIVFRFEMHLSLFSQFSVLFKDSNQTAPPALHEASKHIHVISEKGNL